MSVHSKILVFYLGLVCATANASQCQDNFSVEGSFLSGKVFKTSAEVPNISYDAAFKNISAYTANTGFTIVSSDKRNGTISAVQTASLQSSRTIPLNITVSPATGGVNVSMVYSTPVGALSPEDAVKTHFCETVAQAVISQSTVPPTAGAARPIPASVSRKSSGAPAQSGLAALTAEQEERITKELAKKVQDAKLRTLIGEAAPTIKDFVSRASCLPDNKFDANKFVNLFNIYAAPGKNLYVMSPVNQTPYHNKAQCLSVARFQAWKAPANNALKFEVVYVADDSGESAKMQHEIVKQPDGSWLFNE